MADGFIVATSAILIVPLITLALGLIIGYLAQRSGFCSIGGMRDLMMFKHTRLFFGYLALIGGALIGYIIFWLIIPSAFPGFFWVANNGIDPMPGAPGGLVVGSYIILAIVGGFGMGLIGVLLGGCPLRQIVMSSEGGRNSLFFVIGLIIGAVVFHAFTIELVLLIFP